MARKDHALLHILTLLQLDKLWTNSFALRNHRPFAFRPSGRGSSSSWGATLMDVGSSVFSDELIASKCWQLGQRLSFSSNWKYETMMRSWYTAHCTRYHGRQLRCASKIWDEACRFGTSVVGFQTRTPSCFESGLPSVTRNYISSCGIGADSLCMVACGQLFEAAFNILQPSDPVDAVHDLLRIRCGPQHVV